MSQMYKGKHIHRWDAEKASQLLEHVENGAYPHVAAEAVGLDQETLDLWIARGKRQRSKNFNEFYGRLLVAQAIARVRAERAVYAGDPKFWLKHGPGKETDSNPGWSQEVKPLIRVQQNNINLVPQSQLIELLLKVLEPFPAARVAAAEVIYKLSAAVPPPKTPKLVKNPALPATVLETTIDDQGCGGEVIDHAPMSADGGGPPGSPSGDCPAPTEV